MGLDIRGCSNIKFLSSEYPDDEPTHCVSVGGDFEVRRDGLKEGYYTYEEGYHFHGGSYGGWSRRRAQLCEFALGVNPEHVWSNPEQYEGKPFIEIINFTDCDGTIGPKTAAKLLGDFEKFQEKVDKDYGTICDGYGMPALFRDMTKALKLAANNGCLRFA